MNLKSKIYETVSLKEMKIGQTTTAKAKFTDTLLKVFKKYGPKVKKLKSGGGQLALDLTSELSESDFEKVMNSLKMKKRSTGRLSFYDDKRMVSYINNMRLGIDKM